MKLQFLSFAFAALISSISSQNNTIQIVNDTTFGNSSNQTQGLNQTELTLSQSENNTIQNDTNSTDNQSQIESNCKVSFCDICDQNNPDYCIQCTPYYELNNEGLCQTCSPSMYFDYGLIKCLKCYRGCQVCTGPNEDDCIQSPPGYVKQVTLSQLIGRDNKFFSCQSPYCLSCPTSVQCDTCLPGFGKTYKGDCQLCLVENCNNCDYNTGYCLSCNIGHYFDLTKGVCVLEDITCDVNEYKVFDEDIQQFRCELCGPGCSYCQNNFNCNQCQNGFFLISDQNGAYCQPCAMQCESCLNSADVCTSCDNPNSFLLDGGCVFQCPKGYYEDKVNQKCKQCDHGCDQCTGPQQCISCMSSAIQQLVNGTCQRICPSGQFEYFPVLKNIYDNIFNLTQEIQVQQIIKRLSNLDFVFPINDLKCEKCSGTCKECLLFDSFCIYCQDGTMLSIENKTCVSECGDGFYKTTSPLYPGEVCQACQNNLCKNCTSETCLECYPPYELEDGKCHYPLFDYLEEGQVCPSDKPDQLGEYCTFQCPVGMNHQDNTTNYCFCDDTCAECTLGNSKYQTDCLSCYNTTLKVLDYKCVEQCPIGYYEIKNFDIYDLKMYRDHMSGQCVKKCPTGYVVYIGDYIPFLHQKCLQGCPFGTREIVAGYCVDVVCPRGYFLNTSISIFNQLNSTNFTAPVFNIPTPKQGVSNLIGSKNNRNLMDTNNETNTTNVTQQNQANLIQKLKVIQKSACQPCPQFCKECTQYECLICASGTFLRNGKCVTQCNIDEYLTRNGVCVECIEDCLACKNGKVFYENSCYTPCYPFLGDKCGMDSFKIKSYYTANGSEFGILSPNSLFDIWWIIEQPPDWDKNLTLNNLELNFQLYNARTLQLISNFTETSKELPKVVRATQTAKIGYSFDEGIFDLDQILLTNCTIGITEYYWNGQRKDFNANIITIAYLVPAPQGVFNVIKADQNNTFTLNLNGFNPIFSISPQQYFEQYQNNQKFNDVIQDKLKNLLYQPYTIQVIAQQMSANNTPIEGSSTLIYEKNDIWEPFINFTQNFTYEADKSYRFIANVTSPWFDPQIFINNNDTKIQIETVPPTESKKLRYEPDHKITTMNSANQTNVTDSSPFQELLQFTKMFKINQLSIYGSQL